METLQDNLQLISLVGAYLTYALWVVTHFLHKDKESFNEQIKVTTVCHNTKLYNDYLNKKISAMEYKRLKRDYVSELRTAKMVNMIASPVLAIPVTLTLGLCFLKDLLS